MADKGSKRILHCEVMKIKEQAHDGPASSDRKIVIKYETKDYKGDDTNGKETFYNGKYNHKMFKELKATLDELLEGDEDEFTLYQTKSEEYWDTDEIKVGLEGTHGLQVTGGVQGGSTGSGGGGGSYDNVGAKAGMLLNNAVLILTSSDKEVTEASILKTADFLDGVVEKLKAGQGGSTPTPAVEDDEDEEEEEAPKPKKKATKPKKKKAKVVEEDDSDPFGD